MEPKKISKMSVRGIGCKPLPSETPTPLCVIFGRAESVKVSEDRASRALSVLVGAFEGVNVSSGARYRSAKLFLPTGIHEAVETQVRQIKTPGNALQFALKLQSVKASNALGYSYQAARLVPMEESDVLTGLRATVAGFISTPEVKTPEPGPEPEAPAPEPFVNNAPPPEPEAAAALPKPASAPADVGKGKKKGGKHAR